jgi:hypothetical protein
MQYQDCGTHLLLTRGSLRWMKSLPAPSALLLDGTAECLIDVTGQVRRDRLAQRRRYGAQAIDAFLDWAPRHREPCPECPAYAHFMVATLLAQQPFSSAAQPRVCCPAGWRTGVGPTDRCRSCTGIPGIATYADSERLLARTFPGPRWPQ